MPIQVFIAYDMTIPGGIGNHFEYARDELATSHVVQWAASDDNETQGELWRNAVRPRLEQADRFVAFLDQPNANVGFEIGYALGHVEGRRAALARVSAELPAWLKLAPLNGFLCPRFVNGPELAEQLQSDAAKDWLTLPPRPRPGKRVVVLCPEEAGANWIKPIQKGWPAWTLLPQQGWTFNDIADKLADVGTVVWLIAAHHEGEDQRDGRENAAFSIVAGYALACGMRLKVLWDSAAREVCDVMPMALRFDNRAGLERHLKAIADELAAVEASAAPAPAGAAVPAGPPRPDVGPLPRLDTAALQSRFIGRERMLSDLSDAVAGLDQRFRQVTSMGGARVQGIWYHGFGGMGKSWLLRRAIQAIQQQLPAARVALIDWDLAGWRAPLLQPPERAKELFDAIAWRLAQLYGVQTLDPYWAADRRALDAAPETSRQRERFTQELRLLHDGKPGDGLLRPVLLAQGLALDVAHLAQSVDAVRQQPALSDRIFRLWFEAGGASATDPEAVLRPDLLRVQALQQVIRHLSAEVAPLVLVLDTCELMASGLEGWLRRLVAPLCDGVTPLLMLVGSRLMPDIAEPAGSREVWRSQVGSERWRPVRFDEGIRFTVDEIAQALQRMCRPVDNADALAITLHRVTLGVPLALRTLIDLHEGGESVFETAEAMDDGAPVLADPQAAEAKVVEVVVDRFLLHLRDRAERRSDLDAILALSLLRHADREILQPLWQTERVDDRLRELSQRYSLLAVGDLHATVRSFMRRRWRLPQRPADVDAVVDALWAVVGPRPLPPEFGTPASVAAQAERINAQAWAVPAAAAQALWPLLAEALVFGEQVAETLALAAEFDAQALGSDGVQTLKKLRESMLSAPASLPAWGSDELLSCLLAAERDGAWTALQSAALAMMRGLRESREGQHDAAVARLDAALRAFVDADRNRVPWTQRAGEAFFDAGYAWIDLPGAEEKAVAAFEWSIALGYGRAGSHNNIGVVRDRQLRHDEAEACYRQAMAVDPTRGRYPSNLGDLMRATGRDEEAAVWYRKAIEVDPKYEASYAGLAALAELSVQRDEARAWHRKAVEANPQSVNALGALAEFERRQGRFDEADAAIAAALQVEPQHAGVLVTAAYVQIDRGHDDQAEALLQRALQAHPGDAGVHGTLATLALRQGRYPQARRHAERARELASRATTHIRTLGDIAFLEEKWDEAEALYRQAVAEDPRDPFAHRDLAMLLEQRGQLKEALQSIEDALALQPRELEVLRRRPTILEKLGRQEEAEQRARELVGLDPDNPTLCNTLAWLLYGRRQKLDEAEVLLERAAANSREPAILHSLSSVQLARGRNDEALATLGRWVQLAHAAHLDETRGDAVDLIRQAIAATSAARVAPLLTGPDVGPWWKAWHDAVLAVDEGKPPAGAAAQSLYALLAATPAG